MSAKQEIVKLERQQVRDVNARRLRRLLQDFDPRFVGFSSTRYARIRGRQALADTFRYYLRRARQLRYRIAQPRIDLYGEAAVATFYWTVALGGGRSVRGRGTHVLVRRGRTWRIVHEHFSRAH
ncbi:MAG: nuclear transport factor 2 family protein [Terriglobia bacterium]